MAEMKSAIFSTAIFVALIIPSLIMVGIDALHQHSFMKLSTEVAELVKEEGGVTDRVERTVNKLHEKGYDIS